MNEVLIGIAIGLTLASFSYYAVRPLAKLLDKWLDVEVYRYECSVEKNPVNPKVYWWVFRVVAAIIITVVAIRLF